MSMYDDLDPIRDPEARKTLTAAYWEDIKTRAKLIKYGVNMDALPQRNELFIIAEDQLVTINGMLKGDENEKNKLLANMHRFNCTNPTDFAFVLAKIYMNKVMDGEIAQAFEKQTGLEDKRKAREGLNTIKAGNTHALGKVKPYV
jgi:hypothetical protein